MNEELQKQVEAALEESLSAKLPEFIKAVQEGAKKNEAIVGENGKKAGVKSIMRSASEGELSWRAPFVEAGEEVKGFVNAMRSMARGAVNKDTDTPNFDITNDDEGGYLVPEEVDFAVFAYERQVSVIRSRGASIFTAKGHTRRFTKLDQSVNNFGGVTFTWVDESEKPATTGNKVGRFSMTVHKLMALTVQTNEFLQDSDTNAANFLIQLFGEAAAYAEDLTFFQGDGDAKPLGIITTPNILTVNRETASHVTYQDIVKMYYSIPATLRARAVWFGRTDVVTDLELLVDENKRPLLRESTLGIQTMGTVTTLKNLPFVELTEAYLPALGTKGDLILVVMPHYYILDKTGMNIAVSAHSRFEYDEMEWRFTKRVDGKLAGTKSAVILDVPAVEY